MEQIVWIYVPPIVSKAEAEFSEQRARLWHAASITYTIAITLILR